MAADDRAGEMSRAILDTAMAAVQSVWEKATADSTREDGTVDLDEVISRLNATTEGVQALLRKNAEARAQPDLSGYTASEGNPTDA